jgi:phosphoglycerate-specific signal transduction histidine kinase
MSEPRTYTQEELNMAVQQALSVEVPKAVESATAQMTAQISERVSKPIVCDTEFCNMKPWVYALTLLAALIAGLAAFYGYTKYVK